VRSDFAPARAGAHLGYASVPNQIAKLLIWARIENSIQQEGAPMSEWLALLYKLKPGNSEEVSKLFQESGRPDHTVTDADGNVVGRLLTTMAFVGREAAVRVIEVEGDFKSVPSHMSRQPEVKEFEERIEPLLAEPRDMVSAEGARDFFQRSGMRLVINRHWDD
jgi:SchA/CurD like domain